MPEVVFFTSLKPDLAQLITACAPPDFTISVHPMGLPVQKQCDLVGGADFLLLFPARLDSQALHGAKRLKLIQLLTAGFDSLDIATCQQLALPVANNGGTNSTDVAEHTLSLVLGVYRRLAEMDRAVRSATPHPDSGATTYTIDGKRAGLVGLGHIGQKVARLFKAFGAEVVYSDPIQAPTAIEQQLGIQQVPLGHLLESADIVSLHVPLNAHTRSLIGRQELARMQTTSILINTCRGPVVDESALTQVLQEKGIMAAGLDVLAQEPPEPNNPLLQLDNVLLTPHTAGVTRDTWPRRGAFVFDNMARVWQGEPARALIG